MIRTNAARRPGLSLLEVIVALFVMALGMISLLTLFPLGAIQMGQALRDARAAETTMQADTQMRIWWQRDVVEPPLRTPASASDIAFAALDDPRNTFEASVPAMVLSPIDTNPSYPVIIDTLGWQARNGLGIRQVRLAGQDPNAQMPRRSMQWVTGNANASALSFRVATMMDDITFNESALPDTASTTVLVGGNPSIARQGRYNWAAVVQRPNNSNRNVVDLKILVFDGRAPGIAPLDAELILNTPPGAAFGVGSQQIMLTANASADFLRAGSWIMDGTIDPTVANARRNSVWYRIQAIDKDSTPGVYLIDLQTPLVRPVTPPPAAVGAPVASQFYAFKGLLEVFDRPQLAPPDYKQQKQ